MPLFPIFGKKKDTSETIMPKAERKGDVSVTLTPLGKQKAEQFSLVGPKFDVLAAVLDDGTMSLEELSVKTGHSVNKVEEVCQSLARSGFVKVLKIPK